MLAGGVIRAQILFWEVYRQPKIEEDMDDKELHQYCIDWVDWCRTRKFYTTPTPKNILARLQQPATGKEPNGRNDPDMQFFNMAIHTLVDMGCHEDEFVCFHFCYIEGRRGVKREARAPEDQPCHLLQPHQCICTAGQVDGEQLEVAHASMMKPSGEMFGGGLVSN